MSEIAPFPVVILFGLALAYGMLRAALAAVDSRGYRRLRTLAAAMLSNPGLTESDRRLIMTTVSAAVDRKTTTFVAAGILFMVPYLVLEFAFGLFGMFPKKLWEMDRKTLSQQIEQSELSTALEVAGARRSDVTIWDDPGYVRLRALSWGLEIRGAPISATVLLSCIAVIAGLGSTIGAASGGMARVISLFRDSAQRVVGMAVITLTRHHIG